MMQAQQYQHQMTMPQAAGMQMQPQLINPAQMAAPQQQQTMRRF